MLTQRRDELLVPEAHLAVRFKELPSLQRSGRESVPGQQRCVEHGVAGRPVGGPLRKELLGRLELFLVHHSEDDVIDQDVLQMVEGVNQEFRLLGPEPIALLEAAKHLLEELPVVRVCPPFCKVDVRELMQDQAAEHLRIQSPFGDDNPVQPTFFLRVTHYRKLRVDGQGDGRPHQESLLSHPIDHPFEGVLEGVVSAHSMQCVRARDCAHG